MNQHAKPALLMILLVALMISAVAGEARAQEPSSTILLPATQYKLNRLAPGQTSGQAMFDIDQSNVVAVEIIATIGGLSTSIVGPSGQLIDPTTVEGLGGSFTTLEGGATASDSALMLPSASPGFHYIYSFPLMGAGKYTVHFQASPTLAQEVAVSTQVMTDSQIGTALIATDPTLVLGGTAVLTAAVFDGSNKITGASVSVNILPASGSAFTLILRDDGGPGDDTAGDGLYSGQFNPAAIGAYKALARITGTAVGGTAFSRQAATEFSVIPQTGKLTGIFTDQGVDDDGDGRFDRVAIGVQTNVAQAGKYRAFIHLKTTNGQQLVRSGEADLLTGIRNVSVNFEAAAFLQLGENGPYSIELIELLFIDTIGANPADSLSDVGQTQAYQLSQFQRPAVTLTGMTSDQGVDDNGNGKFDRLQVSIQIDVLRSGFYTWGFKLCDKSAHEIDFASGEAFFDVGLNNLNVTFNGAKIGAFGADGPYQLRDLLLQGPGTSLVSTDVGRTKSYLFTQFEGAISSQLLQFNSSNYSVGEADSRAIVTVTRTGSTSQPASVDYTTGDLSGLTNCNVTTVNASPRCDFTAVGGTLSFIGGQSTATFDIPIVNDVYVEGTETLPITLSNPQGGSLGTLSTATVTINDDDNTPGAANPIDNAAFFVRLHYMDILNREPEPQGFAAWLSIIQNCPAGNTTCDLIEVSSGFFRSPEFFDRVYYIYRFYEVGLGRKPDYAEFQRDIKLVAGFLTSAELEARKQQFAFDFSQRADFKARYDQFGSATHFQEYVDALSQTAGVTLPNRQQLASELANSIKQRWDVLRAIVQSPEVSQKFFNKAFVVIGYFAYLRRDPDAQYLVWLAQLNNPPAGKTEREIYRDMIRGFVQSSEYRSRFGQ